MATPAKKLTIGTHVVIIPKSDKTKEAKGMIKSILAQTSSKTIVELLDGSIGSVKRIMTKPASFRHLTKPRPTYHKPKSSEVNLFSGETSNVEYKKSALWSQNLSKQELDERGGRDLKRYGNKTSKVILAKTIASFLNTNGGNVIIGILENKSGGDNEILGVVREFKKLRNKDQSPDGYRRMILDDIIKPYFPKTIFHHINRYLTITFPKHKGKMLCRINIKKSDHHVFLTIDNKDHFFIKVDAQTRELQGKQIIDYIQRVWKSTKP